MPRSSLFLLVAALLLTPAAGAQGHDGHDAVGTVNFEASCNEAAQRGMDRGVAMLHSFWFAEARETFTAVLQDDPRCGIAWSGIALTFFGNPFGGGTGPDAQARGGEAAGRAVLTGAGSARDSAFIGAVASLYRDHETVPNRTRMASFERALGEMARRFPADTEATIFHALWMVATASPDDTTYARQLAAARIMTPLFERQPDHPGLAHYIIHAYDAPSLAPRALDAARRYAEIAPSAPHALHMPSHTFTRLGYWDESIATNRRSADAEPVRGAKAHPLDYLVYAYLQQGRERVARAALAEIAGAGSDDEIGMLGSYNGRAMPARMALELDDWPAARRLRGGPDDPPSVRAVTLFARALGAARSGDADAARAGNDSLAGVVASLRDAGEAHWAHTVGAQHRAVAAWIAHLEGKPDVALRLAREAADLEDQVEKHPVTPGPLLPARELYGDLLMLNGRFPEALGAYESTMTREPNRLRTLYGAARAARAAGRDEAARRYFQAIRELVDPESGHPALREAHTFLAVGR